MEPIVIGAKTGFLYIEFSVIDGQKQSFGDPAEPAGYFLL